MHISIDQRDCLFIVEIDGKPVPVADYKITSSAKGDTELVLKLKLPNGIMKFEIEDGR